MAVEIQDVSLRIGFEFVSLSSAALYHEKKQEFKYYAQLEFVAKVGAQRLDDWADFGTGVDGYPEFPVPDDKGQIDDALVSDWLRAMLEQITSYKLETSGDPEDKCCTYDPVGKWHKCREFELSIEGAPWDASLPVAAYAAAHATGMSAATRHELSTQLTARAFVEWYVVTEGFTGDPASGTASAHELEAILGGKRDAASGPTAPKKASARKAATRKKATRKAAARKKAARKPGRKKSG